MKTGDKISGFAKGDAVWYTSAINRLGTNAEYQLVDERIVATNAQAAALPLTPLTGYEMLFDRLHADDPVPGSGDAALIIGGAGGVGSIVI